MVLGDQDVPPYQADLGCRGCQAFQLVPALIMISIMSQPSVTTHHYPRSPAARLASLSLFARSPRVSSLSLRSPGPGWARFAELARGSGGAAVTSRTLRTRQSDVPLLAHRSLVPGQAGWPRVPLGPRLPGQPLDARAPILPGLASVPRWSRHPRLAVQPVLAIHTGRARVSLPARRSLHTENILEHCTTLATLT